MKFYKATDKDMKCKGYQFKLGQWSEPAKGELRRGENGYSFWATPSGPWTSRITPDTRIFECEVDDVLMFNGPGTDQKHVCRRVKLIREIKKRSRNHNAGLRNTGYFNTGHCNHGDCNYGDCNNGDCNTGSHNTGSYNIGHRNADDHNIGHFNAGCSNIGNLNTGDYNIGNYNAGYGNIGDNNTGCFGIGDSPFYSFGIPADRKSFPFSKARDLCHLASLQLEPLTDDQIKPFLDIPNATPARIRKWHKALLESYQNNHQPK